VFNFNVYYFIAPYILFKSFQRKLPRYEHAIIYLTTNCTYPFTEHSLSI